MEFNIVPHEIKSVATKLFFEIKGSNNTHAKIEYKLFKEDGGIAEQGERQLPLAALAILTPPIDLNALNVILAQFGVEAISQITE